VEPDVTRVPTRTDIAPTKDTVDILVGRNVGGGESATEARFLCEEVAPIGEGRDDSRILLPQFFEKDVPYRDVDEYLWRTQASVMKRLTRFYNEECGADESFDYWQLIVGYFIHYYVYLLYPKYCYVHEARKRGRFVAYTENPAHARVSVLAFLEKMLTDTSFHEHLYAQVIRSLGCSARFVQRDDSKVAPEEAPPAPAALHPSLKRRRNLIYCLPFGRTDEARLNLGGCNVRVVGATSFEAFYAGNFQTARDESQRKRLANLVGDDEFETLIYQTLAVNMPYRLLEKTNAYRKFARGLAKEWQLEKIVTGHGLLLDASFAFLAAERKKEGTTLHMAQHGMLAREYTEPDEMYERAYSDGYITWGWRGSNVFPLQSSKRISIAAQRTRYLARKKYKALIVSTGASTNITRVMNAIFGYRMHKYIDFQSAVSETLLRTLGANIHIRLYSRFDYGWDQKARLASRVPGLNFADTSVDILVQMAQSELVVFDYLGASSLVDSLRLDIPAMVVYEPSVNGLHPDLEHWYEQLKAVGVVHTDVASLQQALNEVSTYPSVKKWWNEETRQRTVRAFKQDLNVNHRHMSLWRAFFRDQMSCA
jgi:hypothetical protein